MDIMAFYINKKNSIFLYFIFLLFCFLNILIIVSYFPKSGVVNASFMIVLIFLILFIYIIMQSNDKSLFMSVFMVFSYLFFWLAPFIQTHIGRFPNTMFVDENLIVRTNGIVLLFILSVFFFRNIIKKTMRHKPIYISSKSVNYFLIMAYLLFSLLLFGLFHEYLINMLFKRLSILDLLQSEGLVLRKFVFSLPLFLLYALLLEPKLQNSKWQWLCVLTALFIVFIFKNPYIERRNAIGPAYLTFIYLLFRKRVKNNYILISVLMLFFVVLFPVAQSITHYNVSIGDSAEAIKQTVKNIDYEKSLTSLDYDAWSEIMATMEYVERNGVTYGRQVLGAFLFFIPRTLWSAKPYGSGQFIAEKHLMINHSMWFSNLSNPIPSEGYLNFGLLGVILAGFAIALIGVICDRLMKCDDIRKIWGTYICFHMFFLLRGDLMSSFAFLMAVMFAIYLLPIFINTIYFKIIYLKHKIE